MKKEEFYILNSFYNGFVGRASTKTDIFLKKNLHNSNIIRMLTENGYVDENGVLTTKAIQDLEPYKVSNAIILAAGASTRFIPLSLEQPKGLFEVKGEKLIERQIKQLQEAGITDITIVLGYKKEMFFYLKNKYNVKFIFNSSFNVKNNIESIYLSRTELKNTYICVSDSYYVENPFNQYEYQTFYSGMCVNEATNEMYVDVDESGKIIKMVKGREKGYILLGHSFWKKDFSDAFMAIAEKDRKIGRYDQAFWEWLVKENLNQLPDIYLKEYELGTIFEFDYFEELRKFDKQYLENTHSEIIRNIKLIFRCDEEDIIDFRNVSEGLTNTSFVFRIGEEDYIYRHPGDGTENIINRRNEKKSLMKAKEIGVDPTYIYADINEGWKISQFISKFREPEYSSFEDSKKVLEVLRKLHAADVTMDYGMKPWEDSLEMERLLVKKNPGCFKKYDSLKEKIGRLYEKTIGDGVEKCFCHGDTYRPNWMIQPDGRVILIDWEYSGYSDPGIDVGYYIVDAMYDFNQAEKFIREYLQDTYSEKRVFHFMAYTAIIAYYWFVWALYRESCGAVIGDALTNWHNMAEKYVNYLL